MMNLLLGIFLCFLFTACGKQVSGSREKTLNNASALMNEKRYAEAVAELKPVADQNPGDKELQIKLIHAYAGAGGFEALNFYHLVEELEKRLEHDWSKVEGRTLLPTLKKSLEVIPVFSDDKKVNLALALKKYEAWASSGEMTQEDYLKLGTLYFYRFLLNLRSYAEKMLDQYEKDSSVKNKSYFLRLGASAFKDLSSDLFNTYQAFSHSYERVKKVTDRLKVVINSVLENESLKTEAFDKSKSYDHFIKNFVSDNRHFVSELFAKGLAFYRDQSYQQKIEDIVFKNTNTPELKKEAANLVLLVEVYAKQIYQENSAQEEKLKGIFTPAFVQGIQDTILKSYEDVSLKPMRSWLDLHGTEMATFDDTLNLLKNYTDPKAIPADIATEQRALYLKVNMEQMKIDFIDLSKEAESRLELYLKVVNEQRLKDLKDILVERNKLMADFDWLSNEMDGSIKDILKILTEEGQDAKGILNVWRLVEDTVKSSSIN